MSVLRYSTSANKYYDRNSQNKDERKWGRYPIFSLLLMCNILRNKKSQGRKKVNVPSAYYYYFYFIYMCVCLVKLKHVMEDCFTKSFYSVCVSEEKVKSEVNDHNM